MTRDRLRQFDSLLRELEEEQDRLRREMRHARLMEEQYGVGCLFGAGYLDETWERVRSLSARREAEMGEVRGYIDGVKDSMTRRALRLRYIDGLSWSEVARRMGYAEESGPRKLVERLLGGGKTGA